ncbi:hypothetical protein SynBMKMC1_01171 [Synechococcus sp. BMK-MC-1]|nr:hypothetical protein SynBMKMC1_01171 [Synechococcus sp. BMK-MC-1]
MKVPLLLGALPLSASPALADNFVDLRCDAMASLITKQVSTNQELENIQIEEQGFSRWILPIVAS